MLDFALSGLGWQQDVPDFRDRSPDQPEVLELLQRLKLSHTSQKSAPTKQDLREYFPPARDQQHLNSSSAHACLAMVDYFERRAHGHNDQPSPLFLYKLARKLLGVTGDTGAGLRTTLKAMVGFGVPPERYWPYRCERWDDEPDANLYSYNNRYRSIDYIRLDARDTSGKQVLATVRAFVAAGFPCVFGFPVPSSISNDSDIPYRPTFDSVRGGQAVVAVGYDDRRLRATRGALLVRNSWGDEWGDDGYGWLPYAYVEQRLAIDFWTLLKPEWIESGEFTQPRLPN